MQLFADDSFLFKSEAKRKLNVEDCRLVDVRFNEDEVLICLSCSHRRESSLLICHVGTLCDRLRIKDISLVVCHGIWLGDLIDLVFLLLVVLS